MVRLDFFLEQGIQRTPYATSIHLQHVGMDHGCAHARMSEQFLNSANVISILELALISQINQESGNFRCAHFEREAQPMKSNEETYPVDILLFNT